MLMSLVGRGQESNPGPADPPPDTLTTLTMFMSVISGRKLVVVRNIGLLVYAIAIANVTQPSMNLQGWI